MTNERDRLLTSYAALHYVVRPKTVVLSRAGKKPKFLEFLLGFRSSFTALNEMQKRSSDKNSVRPSVCLSVRHTRGL